MRLASSHGTGRDRAWRHCEQCHPRDGDGGKLHRGPIPYGYTRAVVNGVEKFCRVDTYTGSRTQKSHVCLTRLQLDEMQNTSTGFIEDVQRRSGTSTMNTTPGGGGAMGGGH